MSAVDAVSAKFRSSNSIPVDRALISAKEWNEISSEIIRSRKRVLRGEHIPNVVQSPNRFTANERGIKQ